MRNHHETECQNLRAEMLRQANSFREEIAINQDSYQKDITQYRTQLSQYQAANQRLEADLLAATEYMA